MYVCVLLFIVCLSLFVFQKACCMLVHVMHTYPHTYPHTYSPPHTHLPHPSTDTAKGTEVLTQLIDAPAPLCALGFVALLGGLCYAASPWALDAVNTVLVLAVVGSFAVWGVCLCVVCVMNLCRMVRVLAVWWGCLRVVMHPNTHKHRPSTHTHTYENNNTHTNT